MKPACLCLLTLLAVGQAAAQPRSDRSVVFHVAEADDTLDLLAAEYFGDRRLAPFIMVANKIIRKRRLRPKERLRIPTAWEYQAIAGEPLGPLAARFLGDKRRDKFLADFNGIRVDTTLATGQEIMVPFHVRHVAAQRETLAALAQRFYGEPGKARLLHDYNFLSSTTLNKGQVVIVPITHVRISETRRPLRDPSALIRIRKRKDYARRARKALPQAKRAWKDGDYAAVKRVLADIDVDYLDAKIAADTAFLLGSVHVAFSDQDLALVQFKKVLERRPRYRVSAKTSSPKITALWQEAGGDVIR